MQQINSPFLSSPIMLPSRYSIFKRIANLIIAVIVLILCINLWLIGSQHSANWHNKQLNQLGDSLTSLAARIMTDSLLADNSTQLTAQLKHLTADRHVKSATLFDEKGSVLANNQQFVSVVAEFKLSQETPLVFVRSLIHEQQVIGYLSVILNKQAVMAHHAEYQQQFYQQLQMLMLLAAIAGLIATRAFYKFKYRKGNKDKV
ncbi:AhpA/YtjB family protein [Paraglaciecola aestuariivivens]